MKQKTKKGSRELLNAWVRTRLDPELKRRIEKIAQEEDRNFSEMVRLFLQFGIEELERAGSWVALKKMRMNPPMAAHLGQVLKSGRKGKAQ